MRAAPPPPGPKPVPVARYAEVLAALHHYREPALGDILHAYGVAPADWQVSDAHWTAELAQVEARGHASLALKFAAAYAKERRRIARAGLPLEALDRRPRTRDPAGAPAAEGAQAVALPSYMQRETAVETPAPAAAMPVHMPHPSPAPAPPPVQPAHAVSAGPPARSGGPVTAPMPARNPLHETSSMNSEELMRAATPFMAGKPGAPPAVAVSPAPPPAAAKPSRLGSTADVDTAAIARRVLAFEEARSAPAQAASPQSAPPQAPSAPGASPQASAPQAPGQAPSPPRPPKPGHTWMIVRFDPETGEPLAQPLWREIPEKAAAK